MGGGGVGQRKKVTPPGLDRLDRWPKVMQNLVEAYGSEAVWEAGIKIHGYPPTWINEGSNAVKVAEAIESHRT